MSSETHYNNKNKPLLEVFLMKRILSAIAVLLTLSFLVACGGSPAASAAPSSAAPAPAPSSEAPSSAAPEPAPAAPAVTKLVIGLDDQFPPMGFRDDNNELVGFDIDLAKAVCEKLGIEAVPTPIDWTTKELELDGGKVDVLWNGLTITDARKESMLMSPAYVANAQIIVVKKDSGINTIADLAGKTVALQETSLCSPRCHHRHEASRFLSV